MKPASESLRLRRRRNWMVVAAVAVLLVAMGISLPRQLERRRKLGEANDEVVRQQAALIDLQGRIREAQAGIRQAQAELTRESGRGTGP